MEATNEAVIWAASIQAAASIHSAEIRKSNAADRARLLMNEATHYYHAAMDYFPMGGSPDWWSGPRSVKKAASGEP